MTSAFTPSIGAQPSLTPPFDPALIPSMASALFGALPGEQARVAGVQAPVNLVVRSINPVTK
jgi:hypothetical protein